MQLARRAAVADGIPACQLRCAVGRESQRLVGRSRAQRRVKYAEIAHCHSPVLVMCIALTTHVLHNETTSTTLLTVKRPFLVFA